MMRMMHLTKVQATGWVKVKAGKYRLLPENHPQRKSRCQIEIGYKP